MGILDRFKSMFGSAGSDSHRIDPKGPFGLLPGDRITHYNDEYTVVGVRVLTSDSSVAYHYCLRGGSAQRAVLVAEENPDPVFTMQRPIEAQVDVSADELEGVAEETLRVFRRGKAKVRLFGETGVPPARSVQRHQWQDEDGETVLVYEDYGSARELRLGDPVFEGELNLPAGDDRTGSRPWAAADGIADEAAERDEAAQESQEMLRVAKGSPLAAALALEGRSADEENSISQPVHDVDPTAYDDDEWADAHDDAPAPASVNDTGPITAEMAQAQASWMAPVHFVAGSAEDPPARDDDWLTS